MDINRGTLPECHQQSDIHRCTVWTGLLLPLDSVRYDFIPFTCCQWVQLKQAGYCWKSLEPLFPKIRLADCLRSYRLLVETQTIKMALNMVGYFIHFSGGVSTVVTGILHEYNCGLMVAHVDVLETTLWKACSTLLARIWISSCMNLDKIVKVTVFQKPYSTL